MAVVLRAPLCFARLSQRRSCQLFPSTTSAVHHRPLSQSHTYRYEITNPTGTRPRKGRPSHRKKLKPEEKALLDTADQEAPLDTLSHDMPAEITQAEARDIGVLETAPPDNMSGFFADDEQGDDPGEDGEFQPDDITSTAHGELEQVRELRELERVTVWDMPLLYREYPLFLSQ